MGKPTHTGFKRNVYPTSSVYNQGESERKRHEAIIEAAKANSKSEMTEQLVDELKPHITSIVKRAFMRYAAAHTDDKDIQATEWKRFSSILRRML